MVSLILYGSTTASTTITTAATLVNTTGGTSSSKTTTGPNDGTQFYMEVLGLGGTGTTVSSIPSPTGKGWLYDTTALEGNTLSGTIAAVLRMNDTAGFASIDMIIAAYKRSSGGTFTSIGSTTLTAQSMSSTSTNYSLPATSITTTGFGTGDKLYVQCYLHPQASDGHWAGDPIVNFSSSSSSAGIANQFQITFSVITAAATKDLEIRGRIMQLINKDLEMRARIMQLVMKDLEIRGNVGFKAQKDLSLRSRIQQLIKKDLSTRGRIKQLVSKDLSVRARPANTLLKDISIRGRITGNRLPSGGFTLYCNGSGTVQYDSFRATQYPDPSVALGTITPRIGTTLQSWSSNTPTGTALGFDLSTDGVNWTDVTALNGGSFPSIYSQPSPTVDTFLLSDAGNYTSTNRTGGALSTWTFDTTNRRLIATGGTNGIYLNTAINRADIDIFADMDMSDGGGIVWRYVNSSNFYYVELRDNQSSAGTVNQALITKVASNSRTVLGTVTLNYTQGTPRDAYQVYFTRGTYRRFRITMLGGVITFYMDGNQLFTYTDGSPLGSGQVGLYNNAGNVGSRYYNLWIQPLGDYVSGTPAGDIVTGTFIYSRQRLSTTTPALTPQVSDITIAAFTPEIAIGALVPSVSYTAAYISRVYDDLARLSNFDWYINAMRHVIFRAGASVASPWIVQSAPFGLVPAVDIDFDSDFAVDSSNDLYRNRQIVVGGYDTITPPPATFFGNGTDKTVTLGYGVSSITSITLNGVTQTFGLKGTTGSQWYYAVNDTVVQADDSTGYGEGDNVVISYVGRFSSSVTVDLPEEQASRKAIEGGTGIVESVEDVSEFDLNMSSMTQLANQLLERYGINGRTIIFKTSRDGLEVGQTLTCFVPEHGLFNDSFLITQTERYLKTGIGDSVVWWYKVIASQLPKKDSWAKLLASTIESQFVVV